jgi:hypothetical protein
VFQTRRGVYAKTTGIGVVVLKDTGFVIAGMFLKGTNFVNGEVF